MKHLLSTVIASSFLAAFAAQAGDGPALDVSLESDPFTGTTMQLILHVPSTIPQSRHIPGGPLQGFGRTVNGGCLYQTSAVTDKASATWSGSCDVAGYASGAGTLRYEYPWGYSGYMSAFFEGTLNGGMAEGPGVVVYTNGNRLEATFRYGLAEGQGRVLWADGSRYEGELRSGKRSGKARVTYSDGRFYDGDVVDGVLQGLGTMLWPDGRRHTGHFMQGKPHGQGTFVRPGTIMIEGLFNQGKAEGRGRVQYADGRCFVGFLRDNKFDPQDPRNQSCG